MSEASIISHRVEQDLNLALEKARARIVERGALPYASLEEQLELLNQLQEFEFGRFLLLARGLDGYWTHYLLTHFWRKKMESQQSITPLESFILEKAPLTLATQERFHIFLEQNQKCVRDGARLACLPCGMMGELLYLDFSNVVDYQLFGFDLDSKTLSEAESLSRMQGLHACSRFEIQNAWTFNHRACFDLISSNGLNIYEKSDFRVTELYRRFYDALNTGGILVTSFITTEDEWLQECIDAEDALKARLLFFDVLAVNWQCFRSEDLTRNQLKEAGFKPHEIKIIYDKARMFPTVIAQKS